MSGIEGKMCSSSLTKVKKIHYWHEWEIENFSSCIRATTLKSASFIINNYGMNEWHLKIQYNHNSEYSLHLEMTGQPKPFEIDLKMGIIDANKEFLHAYEGRCVLENVHGTSSFITHKKLHGKTQKYLLDNTLRIGCMINMMGPSTIDKTEINTPTSQLPYDFAKVFNDATTGDIVLKVADQQFHAHKIILSVVSSVFAEQIKNLGESKELVITDLSAETIEGVLKYIYTGIVGDLETMARKFLNAANKYDLKDLKELAEKAICKEVNIVSAAEILILAHQYRADNLKRFVGSFIASNLKEVSVTDDYQTMKTNYPMLVLEIVEATGILQTLS